MHLDLLQVLIKPSTRWSRMGSRSLAQQQPDEKRPESNATSADGSAKNRERDWAGDCRFSFICCCRLVAVAAGELFHGFGFSADV